MYNTFNIIILWKHLNLISCIVATVSLTDVTDLYPIC